MRGLCTVSMSRLFIGRFVEEEVHPPVRLVMVWTLTGFSGSVSFLEGLGLVGNGVKYI